MHPHKTFLDHLLNDIGDALKKEGMKFTDAERRKCACILINLAQRIVHEEYKSIKPWPEVK